MADTRDKRTTRPAAAEPVPPPVPAAAEAPADRPAVAPDEFEAAFQEPLSRTLDLDTWQAGTDLSEVYGRLEREVADAVHEETAVQREIRRAIFPLLRRRPGAVPEAGVYRVRPGQVEDVHRKLLFNGGVEACDGTVSTDDKLPVTITQIGICLVSYHGQQGAWMHRLFRRDLRTRGKDPVEETIELLERRRSRSAVDYQSPRDRLSELARRGIMGFAERAVLLDRSDAVWRMGHGSPTPYELVTGSGMPDLLRESLDLMRRLVLDHKRFVFVPSATSARELLTIGNALEPLEYAVIDTNEATLGRIAEGHYRGEAWGALLGDVTRFVKDCGPKILTGVYRASRFAPCQMFYAHAEHVHEAALIAMADSVLQEHRGFPLLLELAHGVCAAAFGAETFNASVKAAYAHAGEPYRYQSERQTR